ncbi:hypothetical protein BRIN106911_23125 [Brevibacillus invocatus]
MVSEDAIDRWLPLLVRGIVPHVARERQNLAYSISCWERNEEPSDSFRRFFCISFVGS